MADIELVIKIPEDEYDIAKYGQYGNINVDIVRKAIANGTPLNNIRAEIIEPKSDRINSLASVLPYTAHREIQELLCEIMDLRKESEE